MEKWEAAVSFRTAEWITPGPSLYAIRSHQRLHLLFPLSWVHLKPIYRVSIN